MCKDTVRCLRNAFLLHVSKNLMETAFEQRTFKSGCSKVCLNKMIKLTSLDPCLEVHLQLLMMQIYFLCEQPLHSATMKLEGKRSLKCGRQRNGFILGLIAKGRGAACT